MVPEKENDNETTTVAELSKDQQWPQYLAVISANMAIFAAGNVRAWSSPVEILIIPPTNNVTDDFTSQYDFNITIHQFAWIASSIGIGAVIFSIIIGTIQNTIGRKYTLLLLVIPFIIGWAMVTGAKHVPTLLIGRIFCGCASGAVGVTVATYAGEVADKRIRGQLGSYFQLSTSLGILMDYLVGASMSLLAINVTCLIVPFIFGASFLFMPESPYYLVRKHRYTDAVISLKWLHGKHYNPTNKLEELINYSHQVNDMDKTSPWKALKSKASIKAFYISLCLIFLQGWTGTNAVTFYCTFIFQQAHSSLPSMYSSIIVAVIQVIVAFIASHLVDRLGRRFLLIFSLILIVISAIMTAVYFYLLERNNPLAEHLSWLPILGLCLFMVAYAIGIGPIPFIIIGEIFSHRVKAIGASMSISFSWLMVFVSNVIFPNLMDAIGMSGIFWMFSGIAVVGIFFVYLFVPETKGKSFIQIQEMLEKDGFFVKLFKKKYFFQI